MPKRLKYRRYKKWTSGLYYKSSQHLATTPFDGTIRNCSGYGTFATDKTLLRIKSRNFSLIRSGLQWRRLNGGTLGLRMAKGRSKLEPSDLTAVIDTREQKPWSLDPLKTVPGTLYTGDYSILGLEQVIAVERKSLDDLLGCIGGSRDRFEDCIQRLQSYPVRCVIIESTWRDFESGLWQTRSRVHPASAVSSVLGWMAKGIPFIFAGGPAEASLTASRFMFVAAARKFRELGSFYESLKVVD